MRWLGFLAVLLRLSVCLAGQATPPTFNKEVVRIFQTNCQSCHHPGDIAPFSLMDYQSARPWARSIQQYVVQRQMPPWKPAQGGNIFRGARVMRQQDIDTISARVDPRPPQANSTALPRPLPFNRPCAPAQP